MMHDLMARLQRIPMLYWSLAALAIRLFSARSCWTITCSRCSGRQASMLCWVGPQHHRRAMPACSSLARRLSTPSAPIPSPSSISISACRSSWACRWRSWWPESLGYVVSRPILHLRGDYLAIVTIAFGEIVRMLLVNNVVGITGGANGLSGIANRSIFGFTFKTILEQLLPGLFFVVITIFAVRRLENSRLGRAWMYVREDELAAEAMGVDTVRVKAIAFVLGSAWAGLAGVLYASRITVISPDLGRFLESVIMFCIVVLGGTGSIPGVFVGTFGMVVLPELFRVVRDWRDGFVGLAMVLMMIFRPAGLWPSRRVAGRAGARTSAQKRARWLAECPLHRTPDVTRSLTKSFGGLMAVQTWTSRIEPGQILGMIGPNGAGKTTVFNLVTGIYKPDRGTVEFAGRSLIGLRPHAIAAAGIARTFQTIRLFPNLTVLENVMSGRDCRSKAGRGRRDLPTASAARRGAGHPRPGRAASAVHEHLALPQRAGQEPALRRSAPGGDRACAGHRSQAVGPG